MSVILQMYSRVSIFSPSGREVWFWKSEMFQFWPRDVTFWQSYSRMANVLTNHFSYGLFYRFRREISHLKNKWNIFEPLWLTTFVRWCFEQRIYFEMLITQNFNFGRSSFIFAFLKLFMCECSWYTYIHYVYRVTNAVFEEFAGSTSATKAKTRSELSFIF